MEAGLPTLASVSLVESLIQKLVGVTKLHTGGNVTVTCFTEVELQPLLPITVIWRTIWIVPMWETIPMCLKCGIRWIVPSRR